MAAEQDRRYPGSFHSGLLDPGIGRSLAVVGKNLSAIRGEFFPMLLQAGQYGEVALIQHRAAVPPDVAGASALLLFGSTVLGHGGTGKAKRQSADDKEILVHSNLLRIERRRYRRRLS